MAQIQKVIITDYPDGSRVMSNIRNKKGIPFFKENDTYTATRVVTWFDGSPMDDSKVDGKIYLKHRQSGDYYLVNLPNWGETFLKKPNVASLRNISSTEILLLKMGYYKGVTLLGYYAENGGDTPAPIQYYLSDTTEEDDGGSVFEVGGIKLEHKMVLESHSAYFGLIYGMVSDPLENRARLQNLFNAAEYYNTKTVIIGEGVHEIGGESVIYSVNNSELIFEGVLRLANNEGRDRGAQLIDFRADNITVRGMKLDGNRDNNIISAIKGHQFNFVAYSRHNVKFIGGYSINAAQNHIQSTSENVLFEDLLFENSGEHCLYLTLAPDEPRQKVTVNNCVFKSWALDVSGTALSIRDYRRAFVNNCVFDAGDFVRPYAWGYAQSYLEYDSTLQPGETIKHIFRDNQFLGRYGQSYSVSQSNDIDTNGVYIYGGKMEFPTGGNVQLIDGVDIDFGGNPYRWSTPPYKIINCVIRGSAGFRFTRRVTFANNTCYQSGNETSGMLIDLNNFTPPETYSEILTNKVIIKDNSFIGFDNTSSFGIVRTKSGVKTIIEGNKLYGSGDRMGFVTSRYDVVKGNEGIFRFSETPETFENNYYFKEVGTTLDRPSFTPTDIGAIGAIGFEYFDTDLGKPVWWDGAAWVNNFPPNATTTVKGLVNQSEASADTATSPSETYTQAEVQAILTELRDLKTKLRTAGILAT